MGRITVLLLAFALLLPFSFPDSTLAQVNVVTRADMLEVAREIHPPGCTDSMTADYCTLSTATETRAEIYELLKQGNNKDEVITLLVDKYGERILASPVKEGFHLVAAWILPIVGIAAGITGVFLLLKTWLRRRNGMKNAHTAEPAVSMEMEKRVQAELRNWL